MRNAREIQLVLWMALAFLVIIVLTSTYWAVIGPETILDRPDNFRRQAEEARTMRGAIYDRNETLLAQSRIASDSTILREYAMPEMNTALGYYNPVYGVGGVEAAYDDLLTGADVPVGELEGFLRYDLLHARRYGADIRVTLDATLQDAAVRALGTRHGAVVLLSVPGGEVLALASSPGYDPAALDTEWDRLITDPDAPLVNRALAADYLPGAQVYTWMLIAAMPVNVPLDSEFLGGGRTVVIGDHLVACLESPPRRGTISLTEAFIFGCPQPFTSLYVDMDTDRLLLVFERLLQVRTRSLAGYPSPVEVLLDDLTLADVLGVGQFTLTPMDMAVFAAALVNNGNAPHPTILDATRADGATEWVEATAVRPETPIATNDTAARMRALLRLAVESGAARNAAQDGLPIGGYAAYVGEPEPVATFMGFVELEGQQGYAVAVVLENTDSYGTAARIGGELLGIAARTPDEGAP